MEEEIAKVCIRADLAPWIGIYLQIIFEGILKQEGEVGQGGRI